MTLENKTVPALYKPHAQQQLGFPPNQAASLIRANGQGLAMAALRMPQTQSNSALYPRTLGPRSGAPGPTTGLVSAKAQVAATGPMQGAPGSMSMIQRPPGVMPMAQRFLGLMPAVQRPLAPMIAMQRPPGPMSAIQRPPGFPSTTQRPPGSVLMIQRPPKFRTSAPGAGQRLTAPQMPSGLGSMTSKSGLPSEESREELLNRAVRNLKNVLKHEVVYVSYAPNDLMPKVVRLDLQLKDPKDYLKQNLDRLHNIELVRQAELNLPVGLARRVGVLLAKELMASMLTANGGKIQEEEKVLGLFRRYYSDHTDLDMLLKAGRQYSSRAFTDSELYMLKATLPLVVDGLARGTLQLRDVCTKRVPTAAKDLADMLRPLALPPPAPKPLAPAPKSTAPALRPPAPAIRPPAPAIRPPAPAPFQRPAAVAQRMPTMMTRMPSLARPGEALPYPAAKRMRMTLGTPPQRAPLNFSLPAVLETAAPAEASSREDRKDSVENKAIELDVLEMADVDMAEETEHLLGNDPPGSVIRSCKEERLLVTESFFEKVNAKCEKKGLKSPDRDVQRALAYGVEDRVRCLLDQLVSSARHRILEAERLRQSGSEVTYTDDVEGQLEFLSEVNSSSEDRGRAESSEGGVKNLEQAGAHRKDEERGGTEMVVTKDDLIRVMMNDPRLKRSPLLSTLF